MPWTNSAGRSERGEVAVSDWVNAFSSASISALISWSSLVVDSRTASMRAWIWTG